MVRHAKFNKNDFILAAIDLIARGGPAAASMGAIAARVGAPTGSIYHRFTSRSALLGSAWLWALSAMSDEILPHLMLGKSAQAITALIHWTEENPAMALVITAYVERDLIDGPLPPKLHKALNMAHQRLGAGLSALLKHEGKALTATNLALANFAIFDGPIAAMKPLLRGRPQASDHHMTLTINKCRQAALAAGRASLALLE